MSDEKKNIKIVNKIKENYIHLENVIKNELELSSEHGGITGNSREHRWIDFFRKIIPQKFAIEQGVMIMDSDGRISKEVDIAVFDNQYTPYLFQYGSLKFIPIEAVAIVIECKSTKWDKVKLSEWSNAISELKTNSTGIARMAQGYMISKTAKTQNSTRPIKILVSMKLNPEEDTVTDIENVFDIILYESKQKEDKAIEVKIPNIEKNLGWWADNLNKYDNKLCDKSESGLKLEYFDGKTLDGSDFIKFENGYFINTLENLEIQGNPLLSLNFQLNQLLMLINNPIMFPHFAYAELFKK